MESSCVRLNSLESIFHRPGLNYCKPDRNYFIRSQRPQGCKCLDEQKALCALWVNSSIPSRRSNFPRAQIKEIQNAGILQGIWAAPLRGGKKKTQNGFNARKVFNVDFFFVWAWAILCILILFLNLKEAKNHLCYTAICLKKHNFRISRLTNVALLPPIFTDIYRITA